MKVPVNPELKFKPSILPKALLKVIKIASMNSDIKGIAIVGGVIRDEIIKQSYKNSITEFHDLDLVIEGSTSSFVTTIQSAFEKKSVTIIRNNNKFKTIEMIVEGIKIDIAHAREETYESNAQNPQIQISTIPKDLKRRDFTINAIAFDLLRSKIIDPHDGRDAIKQKALHFLHDQSVAEDPTRIIRGARYAARFNFMLSKDSLLQVQSTIAKWPWDWSPNETKTCPPPALGSRLSMELKLLFQEKNWSEALRLLQSWDGFLLFDTKLQNDIHWKKRIHWALRLGINPITAFISGASNPKGLAKRLQLPSKEQDLLSKSQEFNAYLQKESTKNEYLTWSPSQWSQIIEENNYDKDVIGIIISLRNPLWKYLLKWLLRWRLTKSPVTANELIEKGWEAGPSLGEELKKQRAKKLDESIK